MRHYGILSEPPINCDKLISVVYKLKPKQIGDYLIGYFSNESSAQKYLENICQKYTIKELIDKFDLTMKEAMSIEFRVQVYKVKPNRPDLIGLPDDDIKTESYPVREMIIQQRKEYDIKHKDKKPQK